MLKQVLGMKIPIMSSINGTGIAVGDPIEVEAISRCPGSSRGQAGPSNY